VDKLLLRRVRRIIYSLSYDDRVVCETVSRVSREQVLGFIDQAVQLSDVPDVEKGEVLADTRGRGTSQMYKDPKSSKFTVVPVAGRSLS
jgi:hypothetical protein